MDQLTFFAEGPHANPSQSQVFQKENPVDSDPQDISLSDETLKVVSNG